MDACHADHPLPGHLKAFGLGHIDPDTADTIRGHVETCEVCRRAVNEASADFFLDRLRAAGGPDATPVPEKPVAGLARSLTQPSDHTPRLPTPAADIPPELAGSAEYEVVRELGRGGMGVVYLARNVKMGRDEVLKVMGREVMARPGAADRFRREIHSAARLAHGNIVRAYAAPSFGDLLVLAMEYVPGDDLGQLVKARGPLPVVAACYYVQQAAAGLQHAHEKGMTHRDIKPANLIRAVEGKRHTVKILDFGLAKLTSEAGHDPGLTGVGQMLGTPDYIAPEQIRNAQAADIRADIYSLGCTLYCLLAGRPPFRADGLYALLYQHQSADPTPLPEVRPAVSAELWAVVARMMAKDANHRYQTPADVAKALAPMLKRGSRSEGEHRGPGPVAAAAVVTARTVYPMPAVATAAGHWWETLIATPEAPPAPRRSRSKTTRVALGVGLLLASLAAVWAAGELRVKTKDGVIVLENLPVDAEVLVDGEKVTVARNGEELRISKLHDGPHQLRVVRAGVEVLSSDVTVSVGGEPVRVRFETPKVADPPIVKPSIPPSVTTEKVTPVPKEKPEPPLPSTAFVTGSVWKGARTYKVGVFAPGTVSYELHVTGRSGTKFTGHVFDNGAGRNRANVEGELAEDQVSWRETSVFVPIQVVSVQGTFSENKISLTFTGSYGKGRTNRGEGELQIVR